MAERVSQEAVDAAAEAAYMRSHERATKQPYQSRFWKEADSGTRAHFHELVRFPLQAALPALEADLRERLAQELEAADERIAASTSSTNDYAEGQRVGLADAANLCRTFSTTEEER